MSSYAFSNLWAADLYSECFSSKNMRNRRSQSWATKSYNAAVKEMPDNHSLCNYFHFLESLSIFKNLERGERSESTAVDRRLSRQKMDEILQTVAFHKILTSRLRKRSNTVWRMFSDKTSNLRPVLQMLKKYTVKCMAIVKQCLWCLISLPLIWCMESLDLV